MHAVRPDALQARGLAAAENTEGALHVVKMNQGTTASEALARLRKNSSVSYAEPNHRVKLLTAPFAAATPSEAPPRVLPNDFDFEKLYGMYIADTNRTRADIDAPSAWSVTTGDRKIIVAVIDTGIDYLHEDLQANIWTNSREIPGNGIDDDGNGYIDDVHGYDFVSDDSDPMDDHGHGTHVSGTIGAVGNNELGVAGVCWQVSMMAVKAFDETGDSTVDRVLTAIDYAIANGARVINASWGLDEESQALHDAVKRAVEAGIIFIAAAGNAKTDEPIFPGSFEEALAVAALDQNSVRAVFSNYGAWVDLAAPGVDIFSTVPKNGYDYMSGTSMAAPHVSGLAALILSRHPDFDRAQVQNILLNTTDSVASDKLIGRGRINAGKALAVNTPLPFAKLNLQERVHGFIDLAGQANGAGFAGYALAWGKGPFPAEWHDFHGGTEAVDGGSLARNLDSSIFPEGQITIRLSVTNSDGQAALDLGRLTVENVMLSSPRSADILRAGGKFELRGTVFGKQRSYTVSYAPGLDPSSWTEIVSSGPTNVADGVLGFWDTSQLQPNQIYTLRLKAVSEDETFIYDATAIYLDSHLRAGWPLALPTQPGFPLDEWRNVRAADLDGDGKSEIVLVDPGGSTAPELRVYNLDAQLLWSQLLAKGVPASDVPVIGDVNGDGRSEIFADTGHELFGFKADGTPLEGKWPVTVEPGNLAKVIADLEQDHNPKLITFSQDYSTFKGEDMRALCVYDRGGNLLREWRVPWCGATNDVQKIFPAVANLDADPELEIVTVWGCSEIACFKFSKPDGPVWRASTGGQILVSPAIGDVDGDGQSEIIVAGSADGKGGSGGIYVFNSNGQLWPGWPVLDEYSFESAPALCDIDGDGHLEICLPSVVPAELHLLQWDGFEADGWPITLTTSRKSGAVIADINGDGSPDILFSSPGLMRLALSFNDRSYLGGLLAWDFSGTAIPLNGSSISTGLLTESSPGPRYRSSPALVGDLDGDGRLDVLACSIMDRTYGSGAAYKNRSSLYLWSLAAPAQPSLPNWPMFGFDPANTGFYSWPVRTNNPGQRPTKAVRDRFLGVEDQRVTIAPLSNDRNATMEPLLLLNFTQPTNGTVSQIGTDLLLYTPFPNSNGLDHLEYTIRDSAGTRSTGSITMRIRPVNDAPAASNLFLQLNRNSSLQVDYAGSDPEGDKLTFHTTTPPAHGDLYTFPIYGTYYPRTNYSGTELFTYVASDGKLESTPATISILVTDTNNVPSALAQAITVRTNSSAIIRLQGKDLDHDSLTFAISKLPAHGNLDLLGDSYRYTPTPDFKGADSFTFTASDGESTSRPAEVQIVVTDENTAPSAISANYSLPPNSSTNLTLSGVDPESEPLAFRIVTPPAHGIISGEVPNITYTPAPNFRGQDHLAFTVRDSQFTSDPATIGLRVRPQNSRPSGKAQSVATITNLPVQFGLEASDAENDPLTAIILKGPAHGRLFGSGTNWTYVPKPDFVGLDKFSYRLWDGLDYSDDTEVSVLVDLAAPPRKLIELESIEIVGGKVRLNLKVPIEENFSIETSSNLVQWTEIVTGASSAITEYQFSTRYVSGENRYFRAKLEP